MKSNRLLLALLASLIVAGGAFYVYDRWQSNVQADAKAKAQHEADQQRIKEEIAGLGAKCNAVSDWRAGLISDSVPSIYSVTLQNVIARNDGRPILFFGEPSGLFLLAAKKWPITIRVRPAIQVCCTTPRFSINPCANAGHRRNIKAGLNREAAMSNVHKRLLLCLQREFEGRTNPVATKESPTPRARGADMWY